MDIFDNHFRLQPHKNPALSAFLTFLVVLVSWMFIGQILGFVAGIMVFDGSVTEFIDGFSNASSNDRYKLSLYFAQGVGSLVGLFILPAIYLKVAEKINPASLFSKPVGIIPWLLAGLITVAFMPVNSIIIEWNAEINFPEFMSSFENWARDMEANLAEMTERLTQFDSFGEFLIGFMVIAIVAGLGEELVFRGMIQNMLHKAMGNIHGAIWLAAFLFSLIHLQFFGFVPRLLLGALFGYLYYWSGNLWVPIFAHVVNNGFMLSMIYLNSIGILNFDLENSDSAPWFAVVIFAIITSGLMIYFRKYFIRLNSLND
ncbi:MAG: CPBP family glutamic-type intramembrane protease [Bacteroidota bacterium]